MRGRVQSPLPQVRGRHFDTVYGAKCARLATPPSGQPASFRVCGSPVPSATCQAACDGVGGYGQVTHSDGIMYDCYEAPAAATDGSFASSVEGGWGLLWVFPATLAELATAKGSTSTLLGSLGIQTNLSEPISVQTGCRFIEYGPKQTVLNRSGSYLAATAKIRTSAASRMQKERASRSSAGSRCPSRSRR